MGLQHRGHLFLKGIPGGPHQSRTWLVGTPRAAGGALGRRKVKQTSVWVPRAPPCPHHILPPGCSHGRWVGPARSPGSRSWFPSELQTWRWLCSRGVLLGRSPVRKSVNYSADFSAGARAGPWAGVSAPWPPTGFLAHPLPPAGPAGRASLADATEPGARPGQHQTRERVTHRACDPGAPRPPVQGL